MPLDLSINCFRSGNKKTDSAKKAFNFKLKAEREFE